MTDIFTESESIKPGEILVDLPKKEGSKDKPTVGMYGYVDQDNNTLTFFCFTDKEKKVWLPTICFDEEEKDFLFSVVGNSFDIIDQDLEKGVDNKIDKFYKQSGLPYFFAAYIYLNYPEEERNKFLNHKPGKSELCAIQGFGSAGKTTLTYYLSLEHDAPIFDTDIPSDLSGSIGILKDKKQELNLSPQSSLSDVENAVIKVRSAGKTQGNTWPNLDPVEKARMVIDNAIRDCFFDRKRPPRVLMNIPGVPRLNKDKSAFEKKSRRIDLLDIISNFAAERRYLLDKDLKDRTTEDKQELLEKLESGFFN